MRGFVAVVVVLVPLLGRARRPARQTAGEQIRAYDVAITIERERHAARSRRRSPTTSASVPHHGILRDLVQREHYDDDHDRRYRIDVESVTAGAGAPVQVQQSTIGPVPPPAHRRSRTQRSPACTATRSCTRCGARPKTFADHDELNWDAIGNQWPVPIDDAHVTVDGARRRSRESRASPDRRAARFRATARRSHRQHGRRSRSAYLAAGSGLTDGGRAAEGHDPATAATDPRDSAGRSPNAFEVTPVTTGFGGGLALLGIAFVVVLATRRGRDRRYTGSAVDAAMGNASGEEEPSRSSTATTGPVEFIPPDDIRPGQVGTLIDEQANLLDVTASIVDLAVRGLLTITELEPEKHERHPDYELTATPGKGKGTPLPYEQLLLHELFDNRNSVKLSDLKYKFRDSLSKIQNAMYDDSVAQGWYRIRPDKTRDALDRARRRSRSWSASASR